MKEHPILFSAPMVRALLDGSKTQTRRVVKWRGIDAGLNLQFSGLRAVRDHAGMWALESDTRTSRETRCDVTPCPYGAPGDRLWVREAHAFSVDDPEGFHWRDDPRNWDVIYRADEQQPSGGWRNGEGEVIPAPWRPSIHMPRWASRITLNVTSVHVERLQAISNDDARAEGCKQVMAGGAVIDRARDQFEGLWSSINGAESWEANPWVWVVEFRRDP